MFGPKPYFPHWVVAHLKSKFVEAVRVIKSGDMLRIISTAFNGLAENVLDTGLHWINILY